MWYVVPMGGAIFRGASCEGKIAKGQKDDFLELPFKLLRKYSVSRWYLDETNLIIQGIIHFHTGREMEPLLPVKRLSQTIDFSISTYLLIN